MIEVTIERLAAGGDGLARHDGMVVFVPLAAAGDRVRVRILERKKGYARGEIVEVVQASPARRTAPCRHFGICGGCTWQHLEYPEQLRWKRELVREALLRIGGIEWTRELEITSADQWGWRARVQWKVARQRGSLVPALGYHARKTHQVVDAEQCPVLAPELERELSARRRLLRDAATLPTEVHACVGDGGTVAIDDGEVTRTVGSLAYRTSARAFFQGNRFLLEQLLAAVLPEVAPRCAWDLYAGAGLFTLPLARLGTRVTAVENDAQALHWLAENVRSDAAASRIEVREEGVAGALRAFGAEILAGQRQAPDLVVLDPPRTGAADAVPLILQVSPKAVTYVSCDPATLARDLKELMRGGYRLRFVRAFDLFPQTHHVEVVAHLDAG